jgi:threonine dehydrogenase-like Zn-dependent dehydrogenase
VVVAPSLSGIGERDLTAVRGAPSPLDVGLRGSLDGIVPGGEVVGVVRAVSPGTRGVAEGERVVVDPVLSCLQKGLPMCGRCGAGETHRCENADRAGRMASGSRVGRSPSAGGGWSEAVLAHESMLVHQGSMADHRAVLAVPAATALHAARAWPARGDRVAVLGTGVPALLLVACLRRMFPQVEVATIERARDHEGGAGWDRRSRAVGALKAWRGSDEAILDGIAFDVSARRLRVDHDPLPVLDGGLDAVFDTTATASTLGLRLLRAGGTYVAAGEAEAHDIEWPLVVRRELVVHGRSGHATGPDGRPALAAVRDWLSDPAFPADDLVTHRFPLEQYHEAISVASRSPDGGTCRVVFVGPESTVMRSAGVDADAEPAEAAHGLLGRVRGIASSAGTPRG